MKLLFTLNGYHPRLRLEFLRLGRVLILCASIDIFACGPDFPNRYLDASEGRMLAAPEAIFAREVERIAPCKNNALPEAQPSAEPAGDRSARLDMSELQAVLGQNGVVPEKARQLAAAYHDLRYAEAAGTLLVEIPAEFRFYLAGARAWRAGRSDEACAHWQMLMNLPEGERRHRSTWAAYMLGRATARRTSAEETRSYDERSVARDAAVTWFRLTRELAAGNFSDVAGLSDESLGWEAFAELQLENMVPAIGLYLRHHQAGDAGAVNSLRVVMRRLLRDEAWRKNGLGEKLAHDPQARRVWTAWLLAQGDEGFGWEGSDYLQGIGRAAGAWAELLKKAGVRKVPEADRLAWVAYQGGNFELAREWVGLASADAGAAEWIRGKLALRAGDLAEGERHLRAAAESSELAPQRAVILGELGRVYLARDQAGDALAVWLEGGHWEDAAYVAERVLSLGELRAWVERAEVAGKRVGEAERRVALRHLLARRLMRANRAAEAESYFSEELRVVARSYAADVRTGFDVKRDDAERAAAFWRAAKAVRAEGMDLLGTELEPDWAMWGGGYQSVPLHEARAEVAQREGGAFAPTRDELARVAEHVVPEKRFHYRYRAAQLAWWAASLMPNDDEETAAVLAEAGGWLKHRDPDAAREFYQALVIRCGRTALGRDAAERRWFPR